MARRHFFAPLRTERLETRVLLAAHSSRPHASDSLPDLSEVEYRSIDGSGNNLIDDTQGAAGTNVIRFGYPAVYDDGHGDAIDVAGRPNARDISNAVHAQSESVVNDHPLAEDGTGRATPSPLPFLSEHKRGGLGVLPATATSSNATGAHRPA